MDPQERAEHAASIVMRFLVSLALPVWGLVMLVLGITYVSGWWIGCGVVVGAIGILFLVGSPITDPIFKDRRL